MPSVIDEAKGIHPINLVLHNLLFQLILHFVQLFVTDVLISFNLSQVGAKLSEALFDVVCVIIDIRDILKAFPVRSFSENAVALVLYYYIVESLRNESTGMRPSVA